MQTTFIIGRVIFGIYWLMSAYGHLVKGSGMIAYARSKGVPAPKLAIYGTGVLMLIGGLCMITGYSPSVGIIALSIFLVGVTPKMHAYWQETDPMSRMGQRINFYKNVALLGALLMMFMIPQPWPFSI